VLADVFRKHEGAKEIFQYANGKTLLETLLVISNKQLFNFTELLNHRYRSVNIGEFLFEDSEFLSILNTGLSKHLDENQNIEQPKKFILSTLKTTLTQIIEHLNNTRKK